MPFGGGRKTAATQVAAAVAEVVKTPPTMPGEESPLEAMIGLLTYGKYAAVMKPLCIAGRAMHMASGIATLKWDFHSFVTLLTTAYGGGILTPLVLGGRPAPLVVDYIPLACVCALYLFTSTSFASLYGLAPIKVFGLAIEAIFRVNLIAAMVANASAALPSRFGPVACGLIAGIGGMFLPFTKGWDAFKPPLKGPICRVLATSLFLAASARPEAYFLPGFAPLAKPTATAIAVAANAIYDVLAYLSTSTLFSGAKPPPAKPTPDASDASLVVLSLLSLAGGAGAFVYTESIDIVDALYLAATTLSTVGSAVTSPAGRLVSLVLSLIGASLFAAAASRAYSLRIPPGGPPALVIFAGITLYLCQLEPKWSIADSASFVLSLATTTGNSTLTPTTTPSKLASVLFIYFARPAFAALAADLAHKFLRVRLPPPRAKLD